MSLPDQAASPAPRSLVSLLGLGLAAALVIAALIALGTWQVHRLFWKLDLIARVDARVNAEPVPPPGPAAWPAVTAEHDEYRHVTVHGTLRNDRETLVQAVTEQGPGAWVLTPLVADQGFTVLINRGFVPSDRRDPATRAAGQVAGPTIVTGLLRLPEPGGSFLRSNDPVGDHWYSRDVAAIAIKRDLGPVAPYFIDQDGSPKPGRYPIGGLTVISFPNNHLVYALTWYGLAVLLGGASVWIGRDEWRRRTKASLALGPARS